MKSGTKPGDRSAAVTIVLLNTCTLSAARYSSTGIQSAASSSSSCIVISRLSGDSRHTKYMSDLP